MKSVAKKLCALAAMAASVVFCGTAHGAPILLKARTIEPEKEAAKPRLMATSATGGKTEQIPERGLYLIQHDGIVTPEWREQLEQCGAIIRSYIPENTYLIEANADVYKRITATVRFAYLGEYLPEYKFQQTTIKWARVSSTKDLRDGGNRAQNSLFNILLFDARYCDSISNKIEQCDGCSVVSANGMVVRARLTVDGIHTITSGVEVRWIAPYLEPCINNHLAVQARMMNVEETWPSGSLSLNLTGSGQVVAVADTGLDSGNKSTIHDDFKGRISRAYARSRNTWNDLNGHGTHVAGSVIGNGSKSNSPKIRGVAYEATLIFQSIGGEGRSLTTPSDLTELFEQAYVDTSEGKGARIHSNSWGSGVDTNYDYEPDAWGVYDINSYNTDRFMFDHHDMFIVFSAGNDAVDADGNGVVDLDSMNSPGTAKNCLTVGAAEKWDEGLKGWGIWDGATPLLDDSSVWPRDGMHQGIAIYSGRGPCDDGRTKPDIIAPGTYVLSTKAVNAPIENFHLKYDENKYYAYMGGTSMATPLTSGAAALARQWLMENQDIGNPDGATIKAVLLAGAKSLNPGQFGIGKYQEIPDLYPNNVEGWGHVDLGNSLHNDNGILVYDGKVIGFGETHTFTVSTAGGNTLAIVMAYTDAPGDPGSSKTLVNDLDLLVKTPTGELIYPNSRTSADNINNVEGVRITSAESGIYTITVKATAINQAMSPSLTGGKANATRYSLVVNGAKEDNTPPEPPVVKKPDLAFVTYNGWPSAAFLSTSDSSSDKSDIFEEGDSIYLFAYFKNVGTADGADFTVRNKVVNVLNDTVVDSEDRPTAARAVGQGGGWNGLAVPMLQGLPAGTYKWVCELDAGSVVEESNEDNNRKEVSFTVTKKAVPLPGAPTSLNVSAGGDKLTVSWNAVSGAVKYNVYRSTTSSKPSSPLDTVSAATAYSDGNVAIGATYYYWVAAVNSEGKEGTVAGPKSGKIDMSLSFDDSSTRQFDANGGNGSVVVTANANWSATVDKSWVRLGVQNGGEGKTTLRFSVDATGETSDRSATITVSAGGGAAQKTLAVSQKGIQANPALGKALDSTGLSFFTGGDSEWVDMSLDDTFATAGTYVRSGALAYGQTGWIETIVSGSGTLQFRYGVSGMAAGTFALIVDGSEVATFSTILGQWKYGSYKIDSSGSHRIRWEYRQNGNATLSGTSYAMLDDVSFGTVARARPAENVSASSGASGVTLNWTLTGGGVSSFNVWRATSLKAVQREKIKTMSASGNGILDQFSCTDGTCQQGITYYYWIESVNASGSVVSEAVSAGLESPYVKFFITEWKLPAVVGTTSYDNTNLAYSANIQFYLKSDVSWISRSNPEWPISANANWKVYVTVEPNTGAEDRHGTLTATDADGNVLCVLPVVQSGMPRNPTPLTWYVDGVKGNDGNDGASWSSAKKTIQAAIDDALSGDEIVVADGTYSPFAVGKEDMTIKSVNGAMKTIVDGDGQSPVATVYGRSTKVIGFRLQNGGYTGMGGVVNGGTWCGCVLTGGSAYRGGGAYTATLNSCLIYGNSAENGGGTYSCTLNNCVVMDNSASKNGGGAYSGTSCNSVIWGNTANGEGVNWYGGTLQYTCTSPLPDEGKGNIASDPMVAISAVGVCSVESSSPCINAGLNGCVEYGFDLVGNPRIGNGVVDIGAIEDLTVAPASPAASIRAAQTGSIKIDIQTTSRATGYVVYRSVSSSPRPGQAHATVNATANATTAYIDNDDVLPGVEYWYWIAAKNEAGESAAVLIGKGYRVPSLSLNGSPLQFSSDGGTLSVGITTDAGWAAFVRDDWASVSPSAGDGNGQIAVSAIRNEKMVSHDTILSVVAGFGTAHPVTNTLSVVQSAAPAPVYRASFHANGGQGDMGALDFQDGAEQALSPCGFTRTGYAFAGWSLEPDGEAFYSDGQAVTLQKDATLYAVWTPVAYTVVFHSNDGTRKSVRQEFVYDAEQSLTANSFAVVGGEFMGWAVEENGGVVYKDKQDVVNLTAEADGEVSLYAVWRALPVSAPVLDTELAVVDMTISISVKQTENAKAYRIYRSTDGAEPSTPHDEVPADGSSVQTLPDMDAEPGIEYHYWVSAVGIGNNESAKTYCGTAYRRVSIMVHGGNDVELVSIGEAKDVPVLANSSWEIESKDGDWFIAEKTVVRYDDREQNVLRITAERTTAYRQGSVTLVAGKETQHPERVTVAVSQMVGNVPKYGPWGDEPIIIMDNVSPTLYDDIVVTFDGEAMAEGDMVALYDQSDRLRAVGKVVFYNGALTLSVSMNVSAGTSLRIVAWRHDTDYDDLLIVSQALIVPGDVSIIEEEQHWTAMHGRPLELVLKTPGWNQISFNVLPDDASPETVFGEVSDKISSVIDGNQNYLNWRPGKGGTLEEITVGAGYWVFAKEVPVRWTVTGTGNPSVTIKLAAGWNMIGYPLYEERPVAEVLKTAIERNLIKTIVDGGHNWPKGTLTTLAPGKGYWFYAQQDCTITFDNN